jgi:hypothetical protein
MDNGTIDADISPTGLPRSKSKAADNDDDDPKSIVERTVEAQRASLRYFNQEYYNEFSEIYRNLHARTKQITKARRPNGRAW